jgi:hypothetical protein
MHDDTMRICRLPTHSNSPRSVAVADINSDGRPDLILANIKLYSGMGSSDNTITVMLNTTALGCTSPVSRHR